MRFLIFSGTSEGRRLAEIFSKEKIEADVCVATEYGKEVMPHLDYIEVHQGRMDVEQMTIFMISKSYDGVIDATHPYAIEVTENIKDAAIRANLPYYRLLRQGQDNPADVPVFEEDLTLCDYLNETEGNIFLSVGSKALPTYCEKIQDISRLYARVLPQEGIIEHMASLGLEKSHMICMQGPFTKELNKAMFEQTDAAYLVTKNSGTSGGFEEKIMAAKEAGVIPLVLGRPKEEGYELYQLFKALTGRELPRSQQVTMIGIGLGNLQHMTLAAHKACEQADVIIGAKRILEAVSSFHKECLNEYKAEKIVKYIKDHPEKKQIVVAFSGDTGFYSGAKKLTDILKSFSGIEIRTLCGISSLQYMSSCLGIPWDEMALCSLHGRSMNVSAALQKNKYVFVLLSDAASVQKFAASLTVAGYGKLQMHVGANLSYPNQVLESRLVREFFDFSVDGICVAVVVNPDAKAKIVTPGIKDDEFIRGEVPMTKEEVRSICISKLALAEDSILYDIGAGTGSISIEAARLMDKGYVYAIEQKVPGCQLIEENAARFGLENLQVIAGQAPAILENLPRPSHAFVGGSSGNLKEIIDCLREKNPQIKVVISAVSLETQAQMMELVKDYDTAQVEILHLTVAKAKKLGAYHMMMGQNPIMILTMTFGEELCLQ